MRHRFLLFLKSSYGRAHLIAVAVALCSASIITWYLWQRDNRTACSGDFDMVIIGAEIIDGLGGPAYLADIGIRDHRVACIGTADQPQAGRILNAEGLTVAPGFIDVHTHVERNVPADAPFLAENFVHQGVTTVITGNCGRSFLDLAKLFKLLETNGAQVNLASLVGHNTVRLKVMKESATVPTLEQLNQMKTLTKAAMNDGALGLSTGLEYIPGTFAKTDEITELARIAAQKNGLYASHIRDEGPKGEAAIDEAISIGECTGIHVHISHFKVQGPSQWGSAQHRLDIVSYAEKRGLTVSLDQYPYIASSTGIAILLPSWLEEGGLSMARHKLSDPVIRKRVRDEMLRQLQALGWKDYSFARVVYCQSDHSLVGLSIAQIAHRRVEAQLSQSQSPFTQVRFGVGAAKQAGSANELERQADAVIDLFSRGGAQMVFFGMNEDDVDTIMKNPGVMFGSDSSVREETPSMLPHPRGSGTFPRIIGLYAREKHFFSIEEAVRRMTSLPAATFGLKDRGQVREGYYADLVIFDRNSILDTATYEKPLTVPKGIQYVIVNGSLLLDQGAVTKSLPGMVIRRDGSAKE